MRPSGLRFLQLLDPLDHVSGGQALEIIPVLFDLARRISRLVHETQKERGETAVVLGSDGQSFASELGQQRAETDRWIADVGTLLDADGLPPTIGARLGGLRDMAAVVAALLGVRLFWNRARRASAPVRASATPA